MNDKQIKSFHQKKYLNMLINHKILIITILIFCTGFVLISIKYFCKENLFYDFLAQLGIFIMTTITVSFLYRYYLSSYEKKMLLKQIQNNMTIDVDLLYILLLSNPQFFKRKKHELKIELSLVENMILIRRDHKYLLKNTTGENYKKNIKYVIDEILPGEKYNRYEQIIVNNDVLVDNNKILSNKNVIIKSKKNSLMFDYKYEFKKNEVLELRFISNSYYRKRGRLLWLIPELSSGFLVEIINKTNLEGLFDIKINHHLAEKIKINRPAKKFIAFKLPEIILPYQGFEIIWDFEKDNT